jgi:hypothetical protein
VVEIALLWERLTFAPVDLRSQENGFGYLRLAVGAGSRCAPIAQRQGNLKIGYLACREAT